MRKVFISYRREDGAEIVGRIYEWLGRNGPAKGVFQDIHGIDPGDRFVAKMSRAIRKASVVLVVIGPRWFAQPGQPSSYVQQEIEEALRLRKKIIPLLVYGAQMPPPEWLPPGIRELAMRDAHAVRLDPDFKSDMRKLATTLRFQVRPENSALAPLYGWSAFLAIVGLAGVAMEIFDSSSVIQDQPARAIAFWAGILLTVVPAASVVRMFVRLIRSREWAWTVIGLLTFVPGILTFSLGYREAGLWLFALVPILFLLQFSWSGTTRHKYWGLTSAFLVTAIVACSVTLPSWPAAIPGPRLSYPVDGGSVATTNAGITADVKLRWNGPSTLISLPPDHYILDVYDCENPGATPTFSNCSIYVNGQWTGHWMLRDVRTTQTSYELHGLARGGYWWSVQSVNDKYGVKGGSSRTGVFVVR